MCLVNLHIKQWFTIEAESAILLINAQEIENDLVECLKFGTSATTSWYFFLRKNIFLILIYTADMAN